MTAAGIRGSEDIHELVLNGQKVYFIEKLYASSEQKVFKLEVQLVPEQH